MYRLAEHVAETRPAEVAGRTCRSCGAGEMESVLDLGATPLADRLVDPAVQGEEPAFPLEVVFCPECTLVQIVETVPPEILFCDNYPYYSSFSDTLLEHSRRNVEELILDRNLDRSSFVVELASNDGYLLKNYASAGIPCLGIDPAEGPARAAEAIGVPTLRDFFSRALARELKVSGRQADIVHANNVLAHVADTNGFVEGVATLLKPGGQAVIEVPYLRELIERCEFDTIYHEHLCYFSVTSLERLFSRHGLFLQRVRPLQIHGGSLRLYVGKEPCSDPSVSAFLQAERSLGMDGIDYYHDFAARVGRVRSDLLSLLRELKGAGKRICAYGAAAKGSTLINTVGIGGDLIDYVVDRNVHKQSRCMPGQHLPIRPPEALLEDTPDYLLLLAWNFADEIMAQQQEFVRRGGRFIVPVPEPAIV